MKNLGYQTDCMFHRQLGQVIRRPRYWLIRNRNNPTHHWGNLLLYPEAPRRMDVRQWLLDFKSEFGEEIGHVTFGWEADCVGELDVFRNWGFDYDPLSVMTLSQPPAEESEFDRHPDGIHFRKIESDGDWESLIQLHFETYMEKSTSSAEAYRVFLVRKYNDYRKLINAELGVWIGAFDSDKLVGDMGLFWNPETKLARFQNVETALEYRRRGICSALMRYVLRTSFLLCGIQKWVIAADVGSGAENLYLKQGFRRVEVQHGICFPKRFVYDLML